MLWGQDASFGFNPEFSQNHAMFALKACHEDAKDDNEFGGEDHDIECKCFSISQTGDNHKGVP